MSGSNSSAPESLPAAPLEPLNFSVHSLPAPVLDERRRTASGRLKMFIVLAVCAAPVIASYFTYYVIRPRAGTNYGVLIDPPRDLPASAQLPLADERGAAVDVASLKGQWLLIVVGRGDCDATCEKLLYLQRQLREALGREKDRVDRVWLLLGDTPMRAELRPALAQATVLHAPPEAVQQWLQPAAGARLEQHLYLVDPMGRWMMRFPPDAEPARVKRDLERLLRAAASWDLAGR